MAMRLNSLNLQKKFWMKWCHLYISRSSGMGFARRGCCEMTIFKSAELDAVDERGHANAVEAVAGHQAEADKIPQRIGHRQNFGRHASFGATNGLALSEE